MPYTPEELAEKSEDYECGLLSATEYRQYLVLWATHTTEAYLSIVAGKLNPEELPDIEISFR